MKIALVGQMRAGKDTVKDLLIEKLSLNGFVTVLTISNGIHTVLKELVPNIYSKGKPRKALQSVGTLFRELDEKVWINKLTTSKEYIQADTKGEPIIVTDVRLPSEVKALKEKGCL